MKMALKQEMKKSWEDANCCNGPLLMKEEDEDEDEDEDALSLCDLPTSDDLQNPARKESPKSMESLEEFNFCSSGRDSIFNHDSELCAADEVFFKGQILPMRYSVSSDKSYNNNNAQFIKSISNVDSIDHCSSGGFTSNSSRSSSISSRYSSSSVNSVQNRVPKTRILNQFQFSHPSPKPHVRLLSSNTKNGNPSNQNPRSAMWSLFRVGLVTTREIDIQELKFRNSNSRNSRKSYTTINDGEKKSQNSFFNFGSCKCSAIGTVDSRIAVMKMNRSQSVKEELHHSDNEKQKRGGKRSLSRRHRTFEWLKQLSLDAIDDI